MASFSVNCNEKMGDPRDSLTSHGVYLKKHKKISHGGVKNNMCTIAVLPEDILILIVNKLDVLGFHRFSAACRFWHSVAAAAKKIRHQFLLKPQFPWLMLSFALWKYTYTFKDRPHDRQHPRHHEGFFSDFHGKVFRLGMPRVARAMCCGSNRGWLIMFDEFNGLMFLLNPFTGVRIELPHRSSLPCPVIPVDSLDSEYSPNYIRKAMLLSPAAAGVATNHSNSNSDGNNSNIVDDCLVLLLYMKNLLAFVRPGDKAWTAFTKHYVADEFLRYQDFIVYDGKLYAIKYNYDLVLVELGPHPKETSCNIAPPPDEQVDTRGCQVYYPLFRYLYLVECHGELLLVIRWIMLNGPFQYKGIQKTLTLKVFKLETQHLRWVKVEDLGDQMLFVGTSTGFSLSALDFPGFKGNCIYFTDGYLSGVCHDLGVFHLEDNSCEPFYTTYSGQFLPIWFAPVSW